MTRREELDDIFKDVESNEKQLVDKLLDDIVYLEEQMTELKKIPLIKHHPKDENKFKISPTAKLYKECSQSYMNAIRILVNILRKTESSAQDELLKKLKEFEL